MSKIVIFHDDALTRVLAGVNTLANAVKITLGPRGRNVIVERGDDTPLIANSGVVVARYVAMADPFENMGAKMVREVASKTSDVAGDGTTTATTLAQAIVQEGMKHVAAGMNPMDIKRGIDAGVKAVVEELRRLAKPCAETREIAQVGAISANNDASVGKLIADAMAKVGKDGAITVEDGTGLGSELEIVEGMQFDRGYLSPYFINSNEKRAAILEDAYVLLCDKKISAVQELLPALEMVMKEGKPLLLVAEEVDGEALATMVVNSLRGALKVCAVRSPGFGDMRKQLLQDIAAVTGATVISEETGQRLENIQAGQLGRARRIEVDKDTTTIVGGAGAAPAISARAAALKSELAEAKTSYDRGNLEQRLAKLSGGVAVIKVGAATETEMKERRVRVDDALHATRAAVEEGIIPGGGVALVRVRSAVENLQADNAEYEAGLRIVRQALEAPLRQIVANAGRDSSVILHRVEDGEGAFGYNAATDSFGDMIEMGVVDPVKVTRCALQNAGSIAGLILTTDCMIAEEPGRQGATALAPGMPDY